VEDKRTGQTSEPAKISRLPYKNHDNSTKTDRTSFIYSELSSSEVSSIN
jgi:hypothetical protein